LTTNPALSVQLGTRHRAAIGITEATDCLALIVSEETGQISAAAFGNLERGLTIERADERISQHFGADRRRRPFGTTPIARAESVEHEVRTRD